MTTVRTIGHGAHPQDELVDLLREAEVELVVDVRRFPGSRRHPHFARDAMAEWLPDAGVAYQWEADLGGRRALQGGSPHLALRNEGFRAYADYMETPDFTTALDDLVTAVEEKPAVMCAEGLWWNCHRRLLADALLLRRHLDVEHVLPDGRTSTHAPTEGVRLEDDRLVYDVGITPPLTGMSA